MALLCTSFIPKSPPWVPAGTLKLHLLEEEKRK
jgi:hypothetical protein